MTNAEILAALDAGARGMQASRRWSTFWHHDEARDLLAAGMAHFLRALPPGSRMDLGAMRTTADGVAKAIEEVLQHG